MASGSLPQTLSPSQERAWGQIIDLMRRAAPHLTFARAAGMPLEQDEQRVAHLLQAAEGVLAANEAIKQAG